MEVLSMRGCTNAQLETYKTLSDDAEIVDDSELTELEDIGIYIANSEKNGLSPCRTSFKRPEPEYTNRFQVVYDPQYSNQPRCCALKNMADGDSARQFKDHESKVRNNQNASDMSEYSFEGITFGRYSSLVYSVLEPTAIKCVESRPCPLVVEVPGAAAVPWLLLQAWCSGCMDDLHTLVLSMDYVDKTSSAYVTGEFVPAVKDFLSSRDGIDANRVYLVSTSKGNEIGLLAVLLHPEIFTFGLFSGKFRVNRDIEWAARNVSRVPGAKLHMISFQIGSKDTVHEEDQDFFAKLQQVVKPIAYPMQMELRYYPGGSHAMWYAGWNIYHNLLWKGSASVKDYLRTVGGTCAPM